MVNGEKRGLEYVIWMSRICNHFLFYRVNVSILFLWTAIPRALPASRGSLDDSLGPRWTFLWHLSQQELLLRRPHTWLPSLIPRQPRWLARGKISWQSRDASHMKGSPQVTRQRCLCQSVQVSFLCSTTNLDNHPIVGQVY